jgi:hypothetical protein
MPLGFQVVIDCHDPASLAKFWATALGYVTQPPPEGHDSWESWAKEMEIPEERWNSMSAVVDPEGTRPRLLFMQVPESKQVKNRVHLDIHVSERTVEGDERVQLREEKVAELQGLGATKVDDRTELGIAWTVMQDPEGNEFCVA